jgi:predicted nucleic-acid-binding Zn-ribbon protein
MAVARFPHLDYSNTVFVDSLTKIELRCPIHGLLKQDPYTHLKSQFGCPKCGADHRSKNRIRNRKEKLEPEFRKKHGNKYGYRWETYKKITEYMTMTCPIHGDFEQTPGSHLYGRGCPKCGAIQRGLNERLGRETIIQRFLAEQGNKYDYSRIPEDVTYNTRVEIGCPKHGFFTTTAAIHLKGHGCPSCVNSNGEREVRVFLETRNINFVTQHRFKGCVYKRHLPFDFYIPAWNIAIEYQGAQHRKPYDRFGGKAVFEKIQIKDQIKRDYCQKYGITLYEIWDFENIESRMQKIINPYLEKNHDN